MVAVTSLAFRDGWFAFKMLPPSFMTGGPSTLLLPVKVAVPPGPLPLFRLFVLLLVSLTLRFGMNIILFVLFC